LTGQNHFVWKTPERNKINQWTPRSIWTSVNSLGSNHHPDVLP
jgi:hypothetical protein